MNRMKKRKGSLLLCLVLLFSACFGPCDITWKTTAAESTEVSTEKSAEAMRDMTSMELVKDMTLGWNLGNSLDVCLADRDGDGVIDNTPVDGTIDETLWGNSKTTPEIFTTLKNQGFNAVRIPVTWRDHLGEAPDYTIDAAWMQRVQEVVDYAYEQGMYVIMDLHHDGGDDTEFGAWIRKASTEKEAVMEKYTAVWRQIAERFQDYSDYLIFESVNEVGFDDLMQSEGCELLNEINQTFVDLIRSSGGNNAKRHLLIGGYWTDISATSRGYFHMPDDPENRCILSLHYYTPWDFCTTDIRKVWGSAADGEEMQEKLDIVKESFIDQGIPVIIGEFGVGFGTEAESRIRFCGHLVSRCKAMGIPCFYWDNGEEFDRSKLAWRTEGLSEAMLQAAGVKPGGSATLAPSEPAASGKPSVKPSAKPTPTIKPPATVKATENPVSTASASPGAKKGAIPKEGDTIRKATGIYQITKQSGKSIGTVTYKRAVTKGIKTLTIPNTITIQGVSYQVTAVGKNACKGCKKLKKVTVGSNVKKMGAYAFKGCKQLKTIRINTASLKSVGKKAFYGIRKKAVVYVPANQKKILQKRLKIKGTYKKQMRLNYNKLTVQQGITNKALDTLQVIGTAKKVKWSSANKKVATVSSRGLVRGVAAGTTTVTAKAAGKKLRCKVMVKKTESVAEPRVTLPSSPAPSSKPASSPSSEPVPNPSAVPTSKPTVVPTEVPISVPSSTPVETESPAWTPLPLFTSEPPVSMEKNEEDVAALEAIVGQYPNSGISDDLDDWQYGWDEDGRLVSINWGNIEMDGILEIRGLSALQMFICDRGGIAGLRIMDCDSLSTVSCSYNVTLKRLELTNTPSITSLDCSNCVNLTEVLIADKTNIQSLWTGNTSNTEWDYSKYPNLETLSCVSGNLTQLDISSNQKLKNVYCQKNQISSIILPEGIEYINCGSNALTSLDTSRAVNLREIDCGDNALSSVDFSKNTQLESVAVHNNQLMRLDFAGFMKLKKLFCSNNRLTELVVDSCTSLKILSCYGNLLTELDCSWCTALNNVNCEDNCLTKLDLTGTTSLDTLYCSNNQLEELGLHKMADLELLYCSANQLTQLDVCNWRLVSLDCSDNPLVSLEISGCTELRYLNFYHTDIVSLDVTEFNNLKTVYCDAVDILIGWQDAPRDAGDVSALESLIQQIRDTYAESGDVDLQSQVDVNYQVSPQYEWTDGKLTGIDWEGCSLTGTLDISSLKHLGEFNCSNNALEQLDISGCSELWHLDCRQNRLTEIDASQNPILALIQCDEGVQIISVKSEGNDSGDGVMIRIE